MQFGLTVVPDPTKVRWPEMIDAQEPSTVFLKPLITSPKIEVGEFTCYNNDVWIGRDAMIMPGVHIGDGAIVASGSVVVSDVPPYTVVGGNPARPLKQRFSDDEVAALLRVAWWDWPIESITEHVREIWTGTPTELEQTARRAGLLDAQASR